MVRDTRPTACHSQRAALQTATTAVTCPARDTERQATGHTPSSPAHARPQEGRLTVPATEVGFPSPHTATAVSALAKPDLGRTSPNATAGHKISPTFKDKVNVFKASRQAAATATERETAAVPPPQEGYTQPCQQRPTAAASLQNAGR